MFLIVGNFLGFRIESISIFIHDPLIYSTRWRGVEILIGAIPWGSSIQFQSDLNDEPVLKQIVLLSSPYIGLSIISCIVLGPSSAWYEFSHGFLKSLSTCFLFDYSALMSGWHQLVMRTWAEILGIGCLRSITINLVPLPTTPIFSIMTALIWQKSIQPSWLKGSLKPGAMFKFLLLFGWFCVVLYHFVAYFR